VIDHSIVAPIVRCMVVVCAVVVAATAVAVHL